MIVYRTSNSLQWRYHVAVAASTRPIAAKGSAFCPTLFSENAQRIKFLTRSQAVARIVDRTALQQTI